MSFIRASGLGPLTASNTATIVDPATPTNGTATLGPLVSFASVASTSGTSIDFIGIPSWTRRVTVVLGNVSNTGGDRRIQLGSGSITTSGYTVSTGYCGTATAGTTSTTGFDLYGETTASFSISGILTLATVGSNIWVGSGTFGHNSQGNYVFMLSGSVTLAGVLDRVRVTTTTGTDTFDAGSVNVFYE